MRLLDRKLRLDLWTIRGRIAALVLIIASGVAILVGIDLAINNLLNTQKRLLDEMDYADLDLLFLPEDVQNLPGIAGIPGVAQVERRLMLPGTLWLRDGKPLTALMVFQPAPEPRLNRVRMLAGRPFVQGQNEVVIDRALAEFHGYGVGDQIVVQVGRQAYRRTVVGIALSPEFLVTSSNPDYVIAEPGSLGVAWGDLGEVSDALGFTMVNDLLVRFQPGHDRKPAVANVMRAMDRVNLEKATPRSESYSVLSVRMDLTAFGVYSPAIIVTLLALSVAMGIITFRRFMVEKQREFGVLRALGFSRWRLVVSLAKLGALLGLAGGVAGIGRHNSLMEDCEVYRELALSQLSKEELQ